jgi:hypothetical protein
MSVLRAIFRSAKGRIALGVLAAYLLWQGWLGLAAPGKVADGFPERARVNVRVTLPFAPERFHVLAMQKHGRVSGTDGNSIEVRSVRRGALAALARPYWVQRVEPLKEDG